MDHHIVSKPTIMLYMNRTVTQDVLQPLLYGIEEEGLPVEYELRDGAYLQLADAASRTSALAVGIGIDDEAIAITYKNIPSHQFIYRLRNYGQYPYSLRILGVNAARLVKGNPFVIDEQLEVAF